MSTKQRVENYVYDNPEDTKTIKKIDKYFKDNKLTYYDRRNKNIEELNLLSLLLI